MMDEGVAVVVADGVEGQVVVVVAMVGLGRWASREFKKFNEALRVSCRKGYPVRVVRSYKDKRSSFAPDPDKEFDHKVCRYLFVRCDNVPAPWTSDVHGDRPRPLPVIEELENAVDITRRKGDPSWDYDEEESRWMWKKPPPASKKKVNCGDEGGKRIRKRRQQGTVKRQLPKEFKCLLCKNVLTNPLTTPCAHNFCKACLEGAFAGQSYVRQRTCHGRRTLRVQKNVMKCPSCANDIADYLQNPQVNRELAGAIESLQRRAAAEIEKSETSGQGDESDEQTDSVADTEVSNGDSVEETEVEGRARIQPEIMHEVTAFEHANAAKKLFVEVSVVVILRNCTSSSSSLALTSARDSLGSLLCHLLGSLIRVKFEMEENVSDPIILLYVNLSCCLPSTKLKAVTAGKLHGSGSNENSSA
ncbi:hypothetical protein Tsubulata_037441 [Turnera subulata]|uniref:RING-type domain-containing protein n=1 Tax=Turnera subulata TaxID=218843 RepID=A0A9Q0FFR1_9ROSI|nr:hypothetical protein Tsubulata_037441 [Turnera subulata]